ncbi:hypothetical protein NKG94_32795 [Micromonospora sp. M12]
MPAERLRVDVEGRALELSNLDKALYPAAGFTKGEVIDYYTRISRCCCRTCGTGRSPGSASPTGGRQVVLREEHARRHPGLGPGGEPAGPGSTKGRETIDYVVADDLPTLVWLANLAALELHTPQWKVGEHPDMMVVDLDPAYRPASPSVARWRC